MAKILFYRSGTAFLPEIDAYIRHFNQYSEHSAFDSSKLGNGFNVDDFDVIWEFKGSGGLVRKDKIIVHEYASLSVGAFPRIKNVMKKKLNPQPNLRIFLNDEVRNGFNFKDNVDFCTRDMGIDESFIGVNNEKNEYEFVYVGSVSRERRIDILLRKFSEKPPGKLCLVGNVEDGIYKQYKGNKDIIFTGKVPYEDVPSIASKAIYGINFIPDRYPYNFQTSTKLLEYLALGLKVITTDYDWVRFFEHQYNCSFYKLNSSITNLDLKSIENHDFKSNFNPQNFLWDSIIEKSGVKDKITQLLQIR